MWEVALHKALRHGDNRFYIDLRFTSGAHRLALYGPSGAGKTQALRMLAGIVRPDCGRVAIAGRLLYDSDGATFLTPQQRKLGYVFQDYALLPHLNVRQNIAFARHRGWFNPPKKAAADDPAVQRWLDAFGLQPVAGLWPHQLSGGQRQRTALARALVGEPTALLLDEPFAALDKPLRQHLRAELRDLQQQLQLPMLLITHDDDDLRMLADEVLSIAAGRLHPPDEERA